MVKIAFEKFLESLIMSLFCFLIYLIKFPFNPKIFWGFIMVFSLMLKLILMDNLSLFFINCIFTRTTWFFFRLFKLSQIFKSWIFCLVYFIAFDKFLLLPHLYMISNNRLLRQFRGKLLCYSWWIFTRILEDINSCFLNWTFEYLISTNLWFLIDLHGSNLLYNIFIDVWIHGCLLWQPQKSKASIGPISYW